jgi:hypothetical protein
MGLGRKAVMFGNVYVSSLLMTPPCGLGRMLFLGTMHANAFLIEFAWGLLLFSLSVIPIFLQATKL